MDTNGLGELVITGGLSSRTSTCETRFERQFTEFWAWNGRSMQLKERIYAEPTYRFHRAADGDLAFVLNQLDQALDAYQDVLFDADLLERDQYPSQLAYCKALGSTIDSALTENEPDQLAAYARWRILVINALKNAPDALQVVYDTLEEKFPEGRPGDSYPTIASAFWENYQANHDIQRACDAANSAAQGQTLFPSHKGRISVLFPERKSNSLRNCFL